MMKTFLQLLASVVIVLVNVAIWIGLTVFVGTWKYANGDTYSTADAAFNSLVAMVIFYVAVVLVFTSIVTIQED